MNVAESLLHYRLNVITLSVKKIIITLSVKCYYIIGRKLIYYTIGKKLLQHRLMSLLHYRSNFITLSVGITLSGVFYYSIGGYYIIGCLLHCNNMITTRRISSLLLFTLVVYGKLQPISQHVTWIVFTPPLGMTR